MKWGNISVRLMHYSSKFWERSLRFVKMRIEQECVIIRYALFCANSPWAKAFFLLRFLGLTLSVAVAIVLVVTHILGSKVLYVHIFGITVAIYLMLMLNEVYEKGFHPSHIQRWKQGFLILLITQATLLSAINVVDSVISTSYQQVRASVGTVVLPGGVVEQDITSMKLLDVTEVASITPTRNNESQSVTTSSATTVARTQETGPVTVVGTALNYPNPCRLSAVGTTIGYYLSKDADIEIRLYDPFANEIYRESYFAGQNGGRGGDGTENYNRISVTAAKLKTSNVPAGIYFFVILNEGRLIGKGKIAALP